MYLKELKISGFKSFADKMNLNFDNNFTCIVGPNGSGKSNIVDAVKWVLGEQSIKTLRGSSNMSDVIFSGSKSRSPLNVAGVTLVFDNTDSYLSLPYSEISVTRKVYRSGENEYYLNNEKCRLKDISDLFLDSGMGRYAFNIISQGEISKIVSDSALDRRVIFEEAAGVLKYKKRKEEALKRLEKTNENLTRITDITSELDSQITPLKEQSTKATQYLEAKDKLENIEIALLANDLEKLNFTYQEGIKNIESLQNEIALNAAKSTEKDTSIDNKKISQGKLNEELLKLNQLFIDLTKEEERLNGEKNIIKERSKYDAKDVKVHENITSLKEKRLLLGNKLLSNKDDITLINKKTNELNNKIKDAFAALRDLINKRSNAELNLSSKKKEIENTTFKIKQLEDYIESGGNTPTSVKRVLSNPKLVGIKDTISKLVSIPSDYALALEVALGGAKDYVVCDNPETAKKSINYLKENALGRVTFFPINVIKPRFIEHETLELLKQEEGFVDTVANLCSYDDNYKNIIYNLLGNVLLVTDIDLANNISKKIGNRYRIITISGEVINVGGSVTGGTFKTRSVISEKYELKNLEAKVNLLNTEIEEITKKVNVLQTEEKQKQVANIELEKEKLLLSEELKVIYNNYSLVNNEYEEISFELNNLQGLVTDTLLKEEEKIINKYYEILNEKDKTQKEITEITRVRDNLLSEIEELLADSRLSNSNIRELESNLKDYEINSTKISTKMDNYLNILNDNYNMTFEKARDNYILELEENVARKNVSELRSEIKRIGMVNIGAIEEYERVSARYEFLTKQSDDLKNATATLLNIIDELDEIMKEEFIKTFKEIEIEFNKVFKELFAGGNASLKLTDAANILTTGIDIVVTPPGKKISSISLLSGGEKTLTAISLLFAILNIKNIPFCIFDEVEAALDEANVVKVGEYLKKYISKTQLIIITHKKKTMEYADTLYGITMQESGVSKLVSVKLME